jgi:hypothetical protein
MATMEVATAAWQCCLALLTDAHQFGPYPQACAWPCPATGTLFPLPGSLTQPSDCTHVPRGREGECKRVVTPTDESLRAATNRLEPAVCALNLSLLYVLAESMLAGIVEDPHKFWGAWDDLSAAPATSNAVVCFWVRYHFAAEWIRHASPEPGTTECWSGRQASH